MASSELRWGACQGAGWRGGRTAPRPHRSASPAAVRGARVARSSFFGWRIAAARRRPALAARRWQSCAGRAHELRVGMGAGAGAGRARGRGGGGRRVAAPRLRRIRGGPRRHPALLGVHDAASARAPAGAPARRGLSSPIRGGRRRRRRRRSAAVVGPSGRLRSGVGEGLRATRVVPGPASPLPAGAYRIAGPCGQNALAVLKTLDSVLDALEGVPDTQVGDDGASRRRCGRRFGHTVAGKTLAAAKASVKPALLLWG